MNQIRFFPRRNPSPHSSNFPKSQKPPNKKPSQLQGFPRLQITPERESSTSRAYWILWPSAVADVIGLLDGIKEQFLKQVSRAERASARCSGHSPAHNSHSNTCIVDFNQISLPCRLPDPFIRDTLASDLIQLRKLRAYWVSAPSAFSGLSRLIR